MRIVVQQLNIEIDNYNGLGMRSDVVVVHYENKFTKLVSFGVN